MSEIRLNQVEPAFASPMMMFQVLDCDVLNRQLVGEAQAMRARSPGLTRSNRDGWHSEDEFFGRTEPGCTTLRTHILEAVQEATQLLSPHFDFVANRALCQGWVNVNPPGAFNAPHDHSGFALSGVYYISVPPEGRSGAIEFLDPVYPALTERLAHDAVPGPGLRSPQPAAGRGGAGDARAFARTHPE